MIDMESDIFSQISGEVRKKYPDVFMTGEYVKSPPLFPCVFLVEMDNTTLNETMTNEGEENHSVVMYELTVYSNRTNGKKTECKEIASFIDNMLLKLNFTRTMLTPIPNQDNATIYRILGRYKAVFSKNKTIYRR